MLLKVFLCLTLSWVVINSEPAESQKGQIIKVQLKTKDQVQKLLDYADEHDLDFWTRPNMKRPTVILIKDEEYEVIKDFLVDEVEVETVEVIVNNVAAVLAKEEQENKMEKMKSKFRSSGLSGPAGYFARLNEIYEWFSKLASEHDNIEVEAIGKTSEGRDMKVLKIDGNTKKPIVFIEAGIHAREWLSPATVVYMISQMVKSKGQSELLRRYQVHILAVANPDGYEYSHENKKTMRGRFWRRTRSVMGRCIGVDMNRNFDADFGHVGVSKRCNSDIYPGKKPFSEPESRNVRDYVQKHESQIKMYMSIHTFGQMWLIPYSFSNSKRPDNWDELKRVAKIGASAIQGVNGKSFAVGTVPQVLRTYASGGSMDWAKLKTKIPYVFGLELRPSGVHHFRGGFNPSTRDINPSGQEIYAAFEAVAQAMK